MLREMRKKREKGGASKFASNPEPRGSVSSGSGNVSPRSAQELDETSTKMAVLIAGHLSQQLDNIVRSALRDIYDELEDDDLFPMPKGQPDACPRIPTFTSLGSPMPRVDSANTGLRTPSMSTMPKLEGLAGLESMMATELILGLGSDRNTTSDVITSSQDFVNKTSSGDIVPSGITGSASFDKAHRNSKGPADAGKVPPNPFKITGRSRFASSNSGESGGSSPSPSGSRRGSHVETDDKMVLSCQVSEGDANGRSPKSHAYPGRNQRNSKDGGLAQAPELLEFHVEVDRTSGGSLGVDVVFESDRARVVEIKPQGLIALWNMQNPGKKVAVGDRIIRVNAEGDRLQERLAKQELLQLTCQRVCSDIDGHVPDLMKIAVVNADVNGSGEEPRSPSPRSWPGGAKQPRSCAVGRPAPEFEAPPPKPSPSFGGDGTPFSPLFDDDSVVSSAAGLHSPSSPVDRQTYEAQVVRNDHRKRSGSFEAKHLAGRTNTLLGVALEPDAHIPDLVPSGRSNCPLSWCCEPISRSCRPLSKNVESPLWLRLCGVLPWGGRASWSSRLYRCAAIIMVLLCFATHCLHFVENSITNCEVDQCVSFLAMCDLALDIGSFLGLVLLNSLASILGREDALILAYLRHKNMLTRWSDESRRPWTELLCMWACSVGFRALGAWSEKSWQDVISCAAFSLSSSAFLGVALAIVHVSTGLISGVDCYCDDMVCCNFSESSHNWNVLQALLRKASTVLDPAFVVLQTTALALLVIASAGALLPHEHVNPWHALSLVFPPCIAFRVFFKVSDITEKCVRMPSLINSFASGTDEFVDMRVHYLVEFITYSAAGFYVLGVRISKAAAMKLAYVSAVITITVMTRVLATQGSDEL